MKNKKIKKIVFSSFAILLALILVYSSCMVVIARQNVFSEMIYSGKNGTNFWGGFVPVTPGTNGGTMRGGKYLEENESINISFLASFGYPSNLKISLKKYLENSDDGIVASYFVSYVSYNPFTKTLTYEPLSIYMIGYEKNMDFSDAKEDVLYFMEKYDITREDITDFQQYAIYQALLPYWFEKNEGASRFSMDDLGDFTIVDNTFQNLDE